MYKKRVNYIKLLSLVVLLSLSNVFGSNAFARRYVIPSDKNVLVKIKSSSHKYLNPSSVKMLVWNLYKGDKDDWKKEYLKLTKGKDLLVLQEVYLDFQMSSVFYNDPFNYIFATSFLDTKNRNSPTGVAIGSTVTPSSYQWKRTRYREPVIKTPKMLVFGEYPLKGKKDKLMVVSIHGINFVAAYKLEHMLGQIVEVAKKHKGPLVVAGDFNSWSKKKVKLVEKMGRDLGLTSAKFDSDDRMKTFGNIIDYTYYRGGKVKNSRVYGESDGSDHKAMELEFDFR